MLTARPADAADAIARLVSDPAFASLVAAHRELEPRPPRHAPWPDTLDPRLVTALRGRGVEALYTHQAATYAAATGGRNAVVVTPTASGKTLCYNLPVLGAVARDESARALYLFPTKALAADQLVELRALADAAHIGLKTHTYDGDTPANVRSVVRAAGQVVITNPDMLHGAILPHHTKWFKLFENLRYVVIDELHTYRGLFGSNVANVIRRLRRVCRHYGANPVFICASATIANPRDLAQRILEAPVELIDDNGAPSGRRHVVVVNPPVVNPQLGIRSSSLLAAQRIAERLIRDGVQTIAFARSRTAVEILTTYLRESLPARPGHASTIHGYRGGYLPNERRAIERGLRDGRIRGVVATNALELGIDIGGLDAAISVGYPGTIASTWQQMGRSGRRAGTSLSVLVASSAPIDQFLATHPDYFFDRSPEHGLVNPDNLHLLLNHLKASAFELPIPADERFGIDETPMLLDVLEEDAFLRRADERYFWSQENFPASAFSLRSGAQENVVIIDTTGDRPRVIGEVDLFAAPMLVHEQAIYIHAGRQYHVDRLDWDERKAYVTAVDVDYYTDADTGVTLKVLDTFDEERSATDDGLRAHGEVMVAWHATLFKKIKLHTHENVGWGPIALPEQQMHTTGAWLVPPSPVVSRFDRDTLDGALIGLARVARHAAALLLMCDPRDVGVLAQAQAPHTLRPTLYIYDAIPGGVGLAARLHELHNELVSACAALIGDCACPDGCPSCVGPRAEVGASGKAACAALLTAMA